MLQRAPSNNNYCNFHSILTQGEKRQTAPRLQGVSSPPQSCMMCESTARKRSTPKQSLATNSEMGASVTCVRAHSETSCLVPIHSDHRATFAQLENSSFPSPRERCSSWSIDSTSQSSSQVDSSCSKSCVTMRSRTQEMWETPCGDATAASLWSSL